MATVLVTVVKIDKIELNTQKPISCDNLKHEPVYTEHHAKKSPKNLPLIRILII